MKFLNGGNIQRIPLDEIEVTHRLRGVRDTFVENLIVMAEDTGITTPIHVRKSKGQFTLIDGAHRLEAARRLGMADIAALVMECRADEARAMEASNNLGAARMTPLQTAVFVASWKRDYYAMHPERKPGVFKGNQHTGKVVEEIISLTTTIADAFGVSERQVRNVLRTGESLQPEEIAKLDAVSLRVTMKDLDALSKVGEADVRAKVVDALADGTAKSTAKALASIKATAQGGETTQADPNDQAYRALMAAWKRAPATARRRFLDECGHDVAALMPKPHVVAG
jgi:ParB family transcriptional regulator, chromosome partitioning protein